MTPSSRFAAAVLTLALAGCATSGGLRAGEQAESAQDYDRAVAEYTRALQDRPDDPRVRLALERARLRASQDHFASARRLEAISRLDQALVEYQIAAELNPGSADIDDALRALRTRLRNEVTLAREGQTPLEALIERARDLPPLGLALPDDATLPGELTFRGAGARDIYAALAQFANLSLAFDPQFQDRTLSLDLRGASLAAALDAVAAASGTFYQVTGPRTITVVPDTPERRTAYDAEIVRTFYLSNADLTETIDLLRIVMDARRIAPVAATNALTIRDTPNRVNAAARVIEAIDKARPEVIIDVELLEVDRSTLRDYGLQLASPDASGIDGAAGVDPDGLTLRDLRNLTQADIFLTNLPSLFYRLLKQDGSTRTLANPQLRTSEGIAATARFGERVPVPVTTFTPLASGGAAQQPITSFNYEDIGVNIDITPRTHHDGEVSLALNIQVSSITGSGFSNLPTFGNREINTVIRLRDGETNLLAGLIRDDEREIVEGVPGLSDLPVIGRLFARTRQETEQTDIVLTLTPHIVRVLDLTEDDLRAFTVRGDGTAADPFGGVPVLPATPQAPAAAPQAQPGFVGPFDDDVPVAIPILPPAPGQPGPGEPVDD
jgi:general secretion pathway protein D